MPRTKIIATLGDGTRSKEAIVSLINAGASIFRINMSHHRHESAAELILHIREAIEETGKHIPMFLDLRGPKLRIGKFAEEKVTIEEGAKFMLTTEKIEGTVDAVSIDFKELPRFVKPGVSILLDDGMIVLKAEKVTETTITCSVVIGGVLKSNKGIAVPEVTIDIPALTDRDVSDVSFGFDQDVDGFMLSFVQKALDIHELVAIMRSKGKVLPVIAKIETAAGVKNLDEIARVSDAVMVARGDLGVDYPLWKLPIVQQEIINIGHKYRKPVIVATEMLESMIQKPRPTRAEVSDVANAVFDEADILMLSAETSIGIFPSKAVKVMGLVAEEAEHKVKPILELINKNKDDLLPESISHATVELAHSLKVKAIIVYSESGFTARMISHFRPDTHIFAFTNTLRTAKLMNLYRGVTPFLMKDVPDHFGDFTRKAMAVLKEEGLLKDGDIVIATNQNRDVASHKRSNVIRLFEA